MHIKELRGKTIQELLPYSKDEGLKDKLSRSKKQDIIFHILKDAASKGEEIKGEGTLEIVQNNYGFLRSRESSYLAGSDDIYVSPGQVKKFKLRTGDTIVGSINTPKQSERYLSLNHIDTVNGETLEEAQNKILYENLTPVFPDEKFTLELPNKGKAKGTNVITRLIDILSPIGKGQRGLIVSPPKAGKTELLKSVAHAIEANHPDCVLIVLLIDERPEEVTDMQRSVSGEVVASTFDEPQLRHVQVSEMIINKAKRLVEHKKDVVILLDSITRLARAYNTVAPSSGKVLTGGVDSNALEKPKRFFGAARNLEKSGSLTIIATALVDTGSKMDEVIYEEFKGTGNMELHLERSIAEKRIFPAINIRRSGTRRDDLLVSKEEQQMMWIIRRFLSTMEDVAAIEFLIKKMKETESNKLFLELLKKNSLDK
ncbi:MAG: transcription termination factor Rho [Candidatus Portiera sp.]|nr:transcription termination factor Rho [Portiera sp.]